MNLVEVKLFKCDSCGRHYMDVPQIVDINQVAPFTDWRLKETDKLDNSLRLTWERDWFCICGFGKPLAVESMRTVSTPPKS
jgi:hypothetical protein